MSQPRLLIVIVAILLVLGFGLGLVGSLLRLYAELSLVSPILAKWLLGLILGFVAILVVGLVYYGFLFLRPQRRPSRPDAPVETPEAAEATLQAIQQQVEQIQDEVARQALLERSQEIAEILSRGAFHLVVFGTGSAGKTSIVNAVLGRMVGEVGAPIGTTPVGKTYSFQLKGLEREIWITDTPGILEAGVLGTEREKLARQLATEADLLLFVLDNDLRQSEYEPLQRLVAIGKRSIVIFNKVDLYTDRDRELILTRLQQRLNGLIAPADIVAIAANPQPILLENGDRFQPEPDIVPLLRRMVAILRSEGETLLADNMLLQFQRLSEDVRQLIDEQRLQAAEKIVERFQWIGAGVVTMTPLPLVDLLATAAVNAQMVVELGQVYGCEMNLERGKELAISLAKTLVGLGVVRGAIELFSIALQTNVGTFVIGRAIHGVTAAYLTRIAGKSFIEYFRHNQQWGDGGMTEVIQQQFQLNRRDEFIRGFVQDAIARVINPLANSDKQRE
jgi:GTPase SAR1 family protein